MNRRRFFCLAATLLAGCESGGHFTLLGYTTRPNYDTTIRTVHIPQFTNKTFRRGLEYDLTRAIITEIESKTPYKVVGDRAKADTELTGCIVSFSKNLLNRNQLNEIREGETVLGVEIVWKDLHSGEILSKPRGNLQANVIPGLPAPDALPDGAVVLPDGGVALPSPLAGPGDIKPVLVTSIATYVPEIGQSNATALQTNVKRLAASVVSLMEKPW